MQGILQQVDILDSAYRYSANSAEKQSLFHDQFAVVDLVPQGEITKCGQDKGRNENGHAEVQTGEISAGRTKYRDRCWDDQFS